MKRIIEEVFKNEPLHWGLRGDPYMFRLLGKTMLEQSADITTNNFSDKLKETFNEIVLSRGRLVNPLEYQIYFEDFPNEGMSGGHISLNWWADVGISHILQTFDNLTGK